MINYYHCKLQTESCLQIENIHVAQVAQLVPDVIQA